MMGRIFGDGGVLDELDNKRQIWFCTNKLTNDFIDQEKKIFGIAHTSQYLQRVFDDLRFRGFCLRSFDEESLNVLEINIKELRRQLKNGR